MKLIVKQQTIQLDSLLYYNGSLILSVFYFSDINGHLQQQQPQHQQQQPQHQQQQHQQQQQSVPQIIICNPPAASQSLSQPQQSTPSSFVPNPAPAQQPPSIVILGGQGGNPSSQGNNQLQGRL